MAWVCSGQHRIFYLLYHKSDNSCYVYTLVCPIDVTRPWPWTIYSNSKDWVSPLLPPGLSLNGPSFDYVGLLSTLNRTQGVEY